MKHGDAIRWLIVGGLYAAGAVCAWRAAANFPSVRAGAYGCGALALVGLAWALNKAVTS
jgi:hypothetical protein